MSIDNRRNPRFREFARAKLAELCHLPGYLEDVSSTGCKVRFPHAFEVDKDQEYELVILPCLKFGLREFKLLVQPQWIKAEQDAIEIGFTVLPSPDIKLFNRYVDLLSSQENSELQEA